ncbi:hypothetical protein [Arachidicoccus sp.]
MELQFIDEQITSFGRLAILKKTLDSLQFEQLLNSLPLPHYFL